MIPENLKKSFIDFHRAMIANGVLDPKTTFMIELGAAMAVGCYPCMEMLTGAAKEKGVTEEELGTIQAIVMAVSAGSVFNQYREVCRRLEQDN
ncbi:MAG: carboxymuconolactone decarboxylase family protein [Pseudomonadota bacterium]|uniref:Carboxymuconolactone decarboxylase family protein n=1 Tax=Candidatus Desulfatibia profunda TaxID=2841695 RepID=A0A8J6TK46_9BACT|nr:carboxymuconolactone decarboxylase family protein [Candidatus Desulfatibia profunda]MBL7180633.1 carboxymuconolactone decarboxylase family protein [Desulfobacterales bacterium]